MTTDESLVAATIRGDRQAFGQLVDRHAQGLFALARRFLPQRQDSEDLVQDVFLSAYRHLDRFDSGRGRFEPWLFTIARRRCLDARARRRSVPLEGQPTPSAAHGPRDEAQAQELFARLDAALDALPVEQRMAFVLAHLSGLSLEDVASVEGVPVGTVKSRIARARQRLAAALPTTLETRP